MTSKGLKLLAYGRVSDVRGRAGESFISPEDQLAKCKTYAETYDHTIVDEGMDFDVSGGKMDRPVLNGFLARIKSGEAQGIIVAKLDRFARSNVGAYRALEEIEGAGGVLISVQEQIDSTTAAGRYVRAIFLAGAEWERERIGEAWTSAKASAVQRGIHLSRHCPPGYTRKERENGISEKTGRARKKILGPLTPDPKYGPVVTEAFTMAAQGVAYARIARFLNERGLPSGDDEHETMWKSSRIKRLLANRVYLGEARSGNGHVNPEAHEPLTDQATWLLAQREQRNKPIQESSEYLLSGFCRCASCRHAMRPQRARGTNVGSYRCSTETASGRCPHPSSVSMNRLHDFVFEAYVERVFARMSERERKPLEQRDDAAALAELNDAHEALSELEALKHSLRPAAYAQALDEAFLRIEEAERVVSKSRVPMNLDNVAEEKAPEILEEIARMEASGMTPAEMTRSIVAGMNPDTIRVLRDAMARELRCVFVRPAKNRSNKAPLIDRVKIIWRDDPEEIELPRRGEVFTPRPYTWAA
jgi:site-specific DNA recombinase